MQRRSLAFGTYDDVLADIEHLQRAGYRPLGRWSLGQICRHLSYYWRGSLDGFPFRLPWIVRRLLGRAALKRRLRTRQMPAGGRTIPASVPPADVDEAAAVAEARELLMRLKTTAVPLHPSPLFDRLSADQWRELHLLHATHHLSLLIPGDE